MSHLFDQFDSVRIINLVHRADRRREIAAQMKQAGGFGDGRITFYRATRPSDAGDFPSVGARGCFESHLAVLRNALAAGVSRLLILEDDFDFGAGPKDFGWELMSSLAGREWDFFYGAHSLKHPGGLVVGEVVDGLITVPPHVPVITSSCVGFSRPAMERLVPYLDAMRDRPAGSLEYGPMHVDGAYIVFRAQHSDIITLAAVPPLGKQRQSRSDITPTGMMLDRYALTQPIANAFRRLREKSRDMSR